MDSYNHYLIARYSWKYPHLFLDQWGKPLYNIMASPFANAGFLGVEILNIGLWLGTAWLSWLTLRKLNIQHAWIGFVLVLLPEVAIQNVVSGLTEYLNAFLLVSFILAMVMKRWNLAAFICGLLPFARSEGFIMMAVCGFYLLFIEKKFKSLLWFVAEPVIFNFIGWMVMGDPLWIITQNPYIKAQELNLNYCGNGGFFHYFNQIHTLFSLAGAVFMGIAGCYLLYEFIRKRGKLTFEERILFWLVSGIFWLYFIVHSFIWWKGMMGSCGYLRVMIVISPLMAILGNFGFNKLLTTNENRLNGGLGRNRNFAILLLAGMLLISLKKDIGFVRRNFPIPISNEQKEFLKVAEWLKNEPYKFGMVYHLYAYLSVIADMDPYDTRHFTDLWSLDMKYAPVGSLIIWDAHFGPNECKLPLEYLMNHQDLKLLKSFKPEVPFKTLNDYPFEIYVFKRVKK